MLKKICLLICMIAWAILADAQDPIFTQFYNSPLYLNPAFAGDGRSDLRLSGVFRTQYMRLNSSLKYLTFGIDKYFEDGINLALKFNSFKEGYLTTNQPSVIFSKVITPFFYGDRSFNIMPAIEVGMTKTSVDLSQLLFADQLSMNGPTGAASQIDLYKNYTSNSGKFDAAAGIIAFFDNYLFGFAMHHITASKTGLVNINDEDALHKRYTFHFSFLNSITGPNSKIYIKPSFIYHQQKDSKYFMAGSLINFIDGTFEASIFYRNNLSFKNNHSICLGVNLVLGRDKGDYEAKNPSFRMRYGYTFDAEANSPSVRTNGGTHEGGFIWEQKINDALCPTTNGVDNTLLPWGYH